MNITFQSGNFTEQFEVPDRNIVSFLELSDMETPEESTDEIVRRALDSPIGSPKLDDLIFSEFFQLK